MAKSQKTICLFILDRMPYLDVLQSQQQLPNDHDNYQRKDERFWT